MKSTLLWNISAAFAGLACCLAVPFSAMAAVPSGTAEGADQTSVYGWVWDSDDYNHIIPVEVSVYPAGSSQVLETGTVKADHYQEKLHESIGDGYHGFSYPVDWSRFDETQLRITAFAVTDTDRVFLGEFTYNKETNTCSAIRDRLSTEQELAGNHEQGPGAAAGSVSQKETEGQKDQESQTKEPPADDKSSRIPKEYEQYGPGFTPPPRTDPRGTSLGMFRTTGYCNCDSCCPGSKLTYSGTVPQAGHTISADISLFPIGTRLMIDDIIYTVEDIGSSVVGNKLDIYYATHEEAEGHGVQEKEVFTVIDLENDGE